MGACCTSKDPPEEIKISYSFQNIYSDNRFSFTILNYDENYEKIYSLSKSVFKTLEVKQNIRNNFLKEMINQINYENSISKNNSSINMQTCDNPFYYRYFINEDAQKILFNIQLVSILLKKYMDDNSNFYNNALVGDLMKSLIIISIYIYERKYKNFNEIKTVIYYLSKMFEYLFRYIINIKNYFNINKYICKIKFIVENNILLEEEKYPFIKSNIISIGEYFKKDEMNTVLSNEFNILLISFYAFLCLFNYNFIINNYQSFFIEKNNLIKSVEYIELNKILKSFYYFLLFSVQDINTGKKILDEFDRQLILLLKQKNENFYKFERVCFNFIYTYINNNNENNNKIVLLSYIDFLSVKIDYEKNNQKIYFDIIQNLYHYLLKNYSNNDTNILDKYAMILSKIFMTQSNFKYFDEQLNSINKDEQKNTDKIIYIFIYFIKYLSKYYRISNDIIKKNILCYLVGILRKIHQKFKGDKNIIINISDFQIIITDIEYNLNSIENKLIENEVNNFYKFFLLMIDDYFVVNGIESVQIYFLDIVLGTIVNIITNVNYKNKREVTLTAIRLLCLIIKIISKRDKTEEQSINNSLLSSLKKINRILFLYSNSHIQFCTFLLKFIYSYIILILIELHKKKSILKDLILKHKHFISYIKQLNIYNLSKLFEDINIQNFNAKIMKNQLLADQMYILTLNTFKQILTFIENLFFINTLSLNSYSYSIPKNTLQLNCSEYDHSLSRIHTQFFYDNSIHDSFNIQSNCYRDKYSYFTHNSVNSFNNYLKTDYERKSNNIFLPVTNVVSPPLYSNNISIIRNDIFSNKGSSFCDLKV